MRCESVFSSNKYHHATFLTFAILYLPYLLILYLTSLDMGDKRPPIFKIALKIISHRFPVITV